MPEIKLQKANQQIKKSLRSNSIAVGFLVLGGIATFIPAFSVIGSRFDTQEFCFNPQNAYNPEQFCSYKNGTIYQGLAWRVGQEMEESLEFRNKVYLVKFKPAERPYTGALGLLSATLFLSAYLVWQLGSANLSNNLFRLIREKKEALLEDVTGFKKHELLFQRLTNNEIEIASKCQDMEQAELLEQIEPKSEGERKFELLEGEKHFTIGQHIHELNLAKLKAQTAEQQEKENKHKLESKKLESKLERDLWADDLEEKKSLEELLKEHEDGWLWSLVKGLSPVIIFGKAGSYKSYTAAAIALCKSEIKEAEIVSLADPDFKKNKKESWKHIHKLVKTVYGENADWESYAQGINDAHTRWIDRNQSSSYIVSIWDELTLMGDNIPEQAKLFMPSVIATPRKCNEDVIMITHSLTQRGLGNCEGMSEAIKEGCFRLKLKSDDLGKPLFKGTLSGWVDSEGNEIEEKEVTLPKWFRPEKIVKLIKQEGNSNA